MFLPGESQGRGSLVGCSPWGRTESDTTKRLHFHFSLSCIGEGNGHPLQCSCLENPRDGGAWWAAVSGVTQSRTWLKWLSSSSSSSAGSLLFQGLFSSYSEQGLLSSCSAWVSHCSSFSYCGAQAVGREDVNSCSTWAHLFWLLGSREQAQ